MPGKYDKAIAKKGGHGEKYKKVDGEKENQERGEGRDAVAHWVLLKGMSPSVAMTTETK